MFISDKFQRFALNELLKFCHISKINTSIVLFMWQLKHCFHLSHLYIHKHTRPHTETHTHAHTLTLTQIKLKQYWSAKFTTSEIQVLFNENIRFNKDSGQTERNELTYLHYLNKKI